MGVKERQERDREALSRSILDAARELFVTHGYQEVSIRKIAERIEYSPAAIYGYFPSKDDIFFALAEEGFRCSFRMARRRAPRTRRSRRRVVRAILALTTSSARTHPEYFALMFLDRTVPRISPDWNRFGFVGEMRHDMVDRILRRFDAGSFRPDVAERGVPCPAHRRPRRGTMKTVRSAR